MTAIVIILMILGLAFIFVSFAISAKLDEQKDENSVVEVPEELTEEQKEKISKLISDYMDSNVDGKLSDIDGKLSEIVNQKTLALGDYAVTVNEEIDRNHKEVMFLYNMLSDKQKEIMTTATMVDDYRKEVETFVKTNNLTVKPVREIEEDTDLEDAIKEIDEQINFNPEEEVQEVDASKDVILEMHKRGLSILEIAKQLGVGVGEVKLVVDLYQGDEK